MVWNNSDTIAKQQKTQTFEINKIQTKLKERKNENDDKSITGNNVFREAMDFRTVEEYNNNNKHGNPCAFRQNFFLTILCN